MPDKSQISDLGGITTVFTSLLMTAWNIFTQDPINTTVVLLTSIGGIVYIFYKIRNEKKKSRLLDLEIKAKLEETK